MEPIFQVGEFVLTPAGLRLQVKAVITAETVVRYLLSDKAVYSEKNLKSAN